ncbi:MULTISPECIES: hypothetical protein [unclassified Streptomyces]|nr:MULTISPECIES: hypothetical protein [unclassified Streptomyces]
MPGRNKDAAAKQLPANLARSIRAAVRQSNAMKKDNGNPPASK